MWCIWGSEAAVLWPPILWCTLIPGLILSYNLRVLLQTMSSDVILLSIYHALMFDYCRGRRNCCKLTVTWAVYGWCLKWTYTWISDILKSWAPQVCVARPIRLMRYAFCPLLIECIWQRVNRVKTSCQTIKMLLFLWALILFHVCTAGLDLMATILIVVSTKVLLRLTCWCNTLYTFLRVCILIIHCRVCDGWNVACLIVAASKVLTELSRGGKVLLLLWKWGKTLDVVLLIITGWAMRYLCRTWCSRSNIWISLKIKR